MSAFWKRKRVEQPDPGRQAAKKAVSDSEKALQEVRGRNKEISAISNRMKELRELNHFGEAITASMELKSRHQGGRA